MRERPNDVHMHGDGFALVPHDLIASVENAKAVGLYAILAMHADWQTGLCHPSVGRLAQLMGYSSRKAFDKALRVLVDGGWVEVFPRWVVPTADGEEVVYVRPDVEGWRQTSNGYVLHRAPRATGATPQCHGGKGGSATEGRGVVPYRAHEQEPINKNQLTRPPLTPQRGANPAGDFSEFWDHYPRQVARPTAERAYRKALRHTTHATIMAGLGRSIRSWRAEGRAMAMIPHPSTWLSQGRWADSETPPGGGQESALDVLARMRATRDQEGGAGA